MNTIGIDYEPSFTVISLNEEAENGYRPVSIGDGLRDIVPNAVAGESVWGSKAVLEARDLFEAAAPNSKTAWIDGAGPIYFWRQLFNHCYHHLGHVRPVWSNGYRLVVSLSSVEFEKEAGAVRDVVRQAGFDRPEVIFSPDALLGRWLSQAGESRIGVQNVLATVVTDACIIVRDYQLSFEKQQVAVIEAGTPRFFSGVGLSFWVNYVQRLLSERLGRSIPDQNRLAVRDAAIEMGVRLLHTPDLQPVIWQGPFRHLLPVPFIMTPKDRFAWQDSLTDIAQLHEFFERAFSNHGSRPPFDRLIWGGPGAICPCGVDMVKQVVPTEKFWDSNDSVNDIALGATWWHHFLSPYQQNLKWNPGEGSVSVEIRSNTGPESPESDTEDPLLCVPPWLR